MSRSIHPGIRFAAGQIRGDLVPRGRSGIASTPSSRPRARRHPDRDDHHPSRSGLPHRPKAHRQPSSPSLVPPLIGFILATHPAKPRGRPRLDLRPACSSQSSASGSSACRQATVSATSAAPWTSSPEPSLRSERLRPPGRRRPPARNLDSALHDRLLHGRQTSPWTKAR